MRPAHAFRDHRVAAGEYARHSWSVLPGTYQRSGDLDWQVRPLTFGLEPVATLWTTAWTADVAVALQWWSRHPYSVLLACGVRVDAVEVSAEVGHQAQAWLAQPGALGPIVVTPYGHWLLLVRPGGELDRKLTAYARLWTRGDWIPLPPTSRGGLAYHWQVSPDACAWTLPHVRHVQEALLGSMAGRGA